MVTAGQELIVVAARIALGPILLLLHVRIGLGHLGGPVADARSPILLLLHVRIGLGHLGGPVADCDRAGTLVLLGLGREPVGGCLVRSLGADTVVDYTRENISDRAERYDVILDNVGNLALSEARRLLTPNGVFVLIGGGGPEDGHWLGPMLSWLKAPLYSKWTNQDFLVLLADMTQQDLAALGELMAAGRVKPVVDRTYPLAETRDAIRYLEQGRARGKVVITVGSDDAATERALTQN